MTLKEQLRQNIFPNFKNAGVVKHGDRVKFNVENGNDLDFQCYIKSCGCMGRIILTPRLIEFDIEAKYDEVSAEVIYRLGEDLYTKKNVGGVNKFFHIPSGSLSNDIDIDRLEEIKATKFDRNTNIYFNDGNDFKIIDADGMLTDNVGKASASLQTVFWTTKE